MAHSPPGHHSVIGQPRAGGLNYPEYVIYRGEQVSSSFMFNFLNFNRRLLLNLYTVFSKYLLVKFSQGLGK